MMQCGTKVASDDRRQNFLLKGFLIHQIRFTSRGIRCMDRVIRCAHQATCDRANLEPQPAQCKRQVKAKGQQEKPIFEAVPAIRIRFIVLPMAIKQNQPSGRVPETKPIKPAKAIGLSQRTNPLTIRHSPSFFPLLAVLNSSQHHKPF
jgi:hypothetical protein